VYPTDGYTKKDVFDYYLKAAPMLLDEIGGRLLSIVRCPDGIGGQHFFQKHARAGFGDAVKEYQLVENDGDEAPYFYVDDVEGLMTLVQMNALEFHPWGSRVDTLEQPDRMVFDLDPDPSIGWSDIKAAAKDVRERLQQVGLESFPKLSGGKGVHVVVPLKPRADWEQVRNFCEAFADAMEGEAPERYVATMSKAKRKGRIFIDWLRNGRGATSVASWSLRAREGAPAAVPVTWAELARIRSPQRYTLADAAKRAVPDEVAELVRKARPLPV
jgi:bifunctional non-homologous end joining protein LigD